MLDTTLPRVRPVGRLFRDACEGHASETALFCGGKSWTFEGLWNECAQVATALAKRRIGSSSCIASWSPNAAEALIAQWAAILVGAQTMYFDPHWETAQAHAALGNTRIDCLFARAFHQGRQYPAMIKAVRAERPGLGAVVTHGREPRFERALQGGWLDFLDSGAVAALLADVASVPPRVTFFSDSQVDEQYVDQASWPLANHDRIEGDKRPICVAVPCWQPIGLSLLLYAHLCGQTIVLMSDDCDLFEIEKTARLTNCEVAIVTSAIVQAASAAGLHESSSNLRWMSQSPALAKFMDHFVHDIGAVFGTVSGRANDR